jgi:hypothetical protein
MSRSLRYLFAFFSVLAMVFVSLSSDARAQGKQGEVVGDVKLIVQPTIRVGQKTRVRIEDLPDPGPQDWLVVVPAGSPVMSPMAPGDEKPLAYTLVSKPYLANGWEIGPIPPGVYEVRWLTTLYNSERKLEVGARAQFSVAR